jgi:flagellar biosynthesis anti-sigma factor FlgM
MANSITGIGGAATAGQADLLATSQASQQTVQGSSPNANDPVATAQISDATNLSSLGNFIATAAKRASEQSSMRSDLVASLKAQIASGTYHPDPNAVVARVAAALKS